MIDFTVAYGNRCVYVVSGSGSNSVVHKYPLPRYGK
jgi:hypothetical protein